MFPYNDSLMTPVVRLLAAALCGAALGWEREAQRKTAGLRTHMLVCLGGATFTILGMDLAATAGMGADPLRVIQGVATGIGFLGAGQILQSGGKVRGLTTAAGIWLTGAIGAACGIGEILLALTVVALALVIFVIMTRLEERIVRNAKNG